MEIGKNLNYFNQNPFTNTYLLNLKLINKKFKSKVQNLEKEIEMLNGTIKFLIDQIPSVI